MQLNTIVSRRVDPAESAVLSVTRVAGGVSHNVLPAEAAITGTVRSFDVAVQDRIEAALRDAAAGVALSHGVDVEVTTCAIILRQSTRLRKQRSRCTLPEQQGCGRALRLVRR